MRQILFTSYANLSLRNNPKDLKLLPQILHKHFPFPTPGTFEILLHSIVDFAHKLNIDQAENHLISLRQSQDFFQGQCGEIAFEAVYGYQDEYCRKFSDYEEADGSYFSPCECHLPGRHGHIGPEFFGEDDERKGRLKCFQCEQLYLINVLNQIIEGEEFYNISGLQEYLQRGLNHNQGTITLTDGKIGITKIWEGLHHSSGSFIQGPDPDYPYKHVFNQYLGSMIAYDLGACLSDDYRNRNRIKRCSQCNIFYISETSAKRGRFCGDKCRESYHNERRKQTDIYNKNRTEKRKKGFYQT